MNFPDIVVDAYFINPFYAFYFLISIYLGTYVIISLVTGAVATGY